MLNPYRYRNLASFFPLTTKSPVYCLFEVTNRCNIRCRMCALWKRGDRKKELSIEKIRVIADNLARLGVLLVSITGGEPFMRGDLPGIVRIFKERGFTVRLLTNGTFATRDKIEKVMDAGLDNVSISLDTLDPGLMEKITGSPNSWHKTMETISVLTGYFAGRKTIPLLNVVVSRLNFLELENIVQFATSIGFWASFIPVQVASSPEPRELFEDYAPDMVFSRDDVSLLYNIYGNLLEMKKNKMLVLNSTPFLKKSPGFLLGNPRELECHVGTLYFLVDHEGKLAPCHAFPGSLETYGEEFIAEFKNMVKQGNYRQIAQTCRGCMHPCWIELSLMLNDRKALYEAFILNTKTTRIKYMNPTMIMEVAQRLRLKRNGAKMSNTVSRGSREKEVS